MKMLECICPVIGMILLGMFCKKFKILNSSGVDNLKLLITKIILPVAIFHALATANYERSTFLLVGIMLVVLVVTFGAGYLMRPLVPKPYGAYVPFLVSVYEGGMMAYPLYINLCGKENLSKIAVLDIAGLLFGFSIYMGILGQMEEHKKPSWKGMLLDAAKNPAFAATVLGIAAGLTGTMRAFLLLPVGNVYLAVKDIITAPLSSLILIVVGFGLELRRDLLRACGRTILLRGALQGGMIFTVLFICRSLIGTDPLRDMAVILYMSAPTTFSMQTYLKNEKISTYAATTNSLYCMVTILVYLGLAAPIG